MTLSIKEILNDKDILARTIYGEARGELLKFGKNSLYAIGYVVLNRFKRGIYGKTIKDICLKPYQFSCWNKRDINYNKIYQLKILDGIFNCCYSIAEQLVENQNFTIQINEDCTNGATHYHHKAIKPYWIKEEFKTVSLGSHIFYKLP